MKKRYAASQKAQIVLEILKEEKAISQIASETGIHTSQLYKWKNQALANMGTLFEDDRKTEREQKALHEQEINKLYTEIGRLTTQLNWLKKKSGIDHV